MLLLQQSFLYRILSVLRIDMMCGMWYNELDIYLKQNHKVLYINLLTSGKLNSYITDIDKQAEEMFILLVKELAENENVTEQLKAENQMLWMHQMNNIHNRVMEIINTDLIYV